MSGIDCQLVVMGPYGRVDLHHVTGFESRMRNDGWEGRFDLERGNRVNDGFAARIQISEHGGSSPAGTLYQYVSDPDGSVSTYQYDGAVFKCERDCRRDMYRVEFFARGRKRI